MGDLEVANALQIRYEVFVAEQSVPVEREWIPEEDARGTHLIVFLNNKPIATGRILITDGKYSLGRIAVLKEHRGQGFGKDVTQRLCQRCFMMGAEEVTLSSQTHAKSFYEKLGFEVCSEEYLDAGIPHVTMVLYKK